MDIRSHRHIKVIKREPLKRMVCEAFSSLCCINLFTGCDDDRDAPAALDMGFIVREEV